MKPALALLAAPLTLATCHPAYAANATVGQLPARGTPAATDVFPCQPAAGPPLMSCKASDLQNYVLMSVKAFGAVGDGVSDDTAAIQAAINSGLTIYLPPGIYKTSSSLSFTTYAAQGQIMKGSGSDYGSASYGYSSMPPAGTAVIRPTSAVSNVFVIDGTPVYGAGLSYIQGLKIENVAVDMVNMTDANSSVAFDQIQAYDITYDRVRVINYGNRKLSWSFNAGSYVTVVRDSQGGTVNFNGQSFSNAATTISLIDDDLGSLYHDYYQNVTITGGAIQAPYTAGVTPVQYLAPGASPYGFGANASGLYVAILDEVVDSQMFTSVGADWEVLGAGPPNTCTVAGWPYGTYNDGTHGCLKLISVLKVDPGCLNTTFINPGFAGMYLLDFGTNTRIIGEQQSGGYGFDLSTGIKYNLNDLRVTGILSGPIGFTGALGTETSYAYTISGSTGYANFASLALQPLSGSGDGQIFTISNKVGTQLALFNTSSKYLAIGNNSSFGGYSDSFTTQTWLFSNVSRAGKLVLYNSGIPQITLDYNGNIIATSLYNTPVGLYLASSGAFTTLTASSKFTGHVVNPGVYTFSMLPAVPADGDTAEITDCNTTVFNALATGGGSNHMMVRYNGSAWVVF